MARSVSTELRQDKALVFDVGEDFLDVLRAHSEELYGESFGELNRDQVARLLVAAFIEMAARSDWHSTLSVPAEGDRVVLDSKLDGEQPCVGYVRRYAEDLTQTFDEHPDTELIVRVAHPPGVWRRLLPGGNHAVDTYRFPGNNPTQ